MPDQPFPAPPTLPPEPQGNTLQRLLPLIAFAATAATQGRGAAGAFGEGFTGTSMALRDLQRREDEARTREQFAELQGRAVERSIRDSESRERAAQATAEANRRNRLIQIAEEARVATQGATSRQEFDDILEAFDRQAQVAGFRPRTIMHMVPFTGEAINRASTSEAQKMITDAARALGTETFLQMIQAGAKRRDERGPSQLVEAARRSGFVEFDDDGQPVFDPSVVNRSSGGSDFRLFLRATAEERHGVPDETQLSAAEIVEAHRAYDQANQSGSLTPQQVFTNTRVLRQEATKESSALRELNQELARMRAGLNAAKQGDMNAGSQAVLVTFQKILDPTSVVRESEYARSAAGLALRSRIEGAVLRLQQGGPGVPISDLEGFARLAERFARGMDTFVKNSLTRIKNQAVAFGLDPALIVPDDDELMVPDFTSSDVVTFSREELFGEP